MSDEHVPSLTLSALAYAAGDPIEGERHFADAFLVIRPLVVATVHRYLTGPEDIDDAVMLAMTSIWTSLRKGEEPSIERHAQLRAIDVFRRSKKHGHVDELDEHVAEREPDDETRIDLIASYAPDVWRDMHDLAEAGWDLKQIALKLGMAPSSVRRIATEIRADYHLRRALAS